jgi:hypothetical protein
MLRHIVTLGMLIASGLLLPIGSVAIGSSASMTLVGISLCAAAISVEATAWRRIAHAHRGNSGR